MLNQTNMTLLNLKTTNSECWDCTVPWALYARMTDSQYKDLDGLNLFLHGCVVSIDESNVHMNDLFAFVCSIRDQNNLDKNSRTDFRDLASWLWSSVSGCDCEQHCQLLTGWCLQSLAAAPLAAVLASGLLTQDEVKQWMNWHKDPASIPVSGNQYQLPAHLGWHCTAQQLVTHMAAYTQSVDDDEQTMSSAELKEYVSKVWVHGNACCF